MLKPVHLPDRFATVGAPFPAHARVMKADIAPRNRATKVRFGIQRLLVAHSTKVSGEPWSTWFGEGRRYFVAAKVVRQSSQPRGVR